MTRASSVCEISSVIAPAGDIGAMSRFSSVAASALTPLLNSGAKSIYSAPLYLVDSAESQVVPEPHSTRTATDWRVEIPIRYQISTTNSSDIVVLGLFPVVFDQPTDRPKTVHVRSLSPQNGQKPTCTTTVTARLGTTGRASLPPEHQRGEHIMSLHCPSAAPGQEDSSGK